jgi:uncharacterized protein (DUF1330 family)
MQRVFGAGGGISPESRSHHAAGSSQAKLSCLHEPTTAKISGKSKVQADPWPCDQRNGPKPKQPNETRSSKGEHMSVYMIAEITVTDPAGFEEYRDSVPATIQQYGGKYLVRGGTVAPLEGQWAPRIVVLEFPDLETAQRWYNSPEYTAIKGGRTSASEGRMVLVEGI